MKQNIIPAVKLSILLLIVFAVIYPALIWAVAPNNEKGELATLNGRVVGYRTKVKILPG
jgi:K+-transporting ATPase ATPase C chain